MANEKSIDKVIKIIGLLVVITLIPIGILAIIYNTNDNFKETTNQNLKDAPGVIGDYFSKFLTEDERLVKVKYIAKNYINLEKKTAADKLYILKKDDDGLYYEIIKEMRRESPSKTEEIMSLVRDIELRKDLIVSIYEEIEKEKESFLGDEVSRFEKLSTYSSINEIKGKYLNNYNELDKLIIILSKMKRDKSADIIYNIDIESKNKLLNRIENYDKEFYKELITLVNEKELKNIELHKKSDLYEVMSIEKAFNDIGNQDKYSFDDLSTIYLNLDYKIAAQILNNSTDEFINELFNKIRVKERLLNVEDSITVNIMNELTKIQSYEKRKNDLVEIYEKMKPAESAKLIEKMFITDPDLIIEILSSMKKSNVSDILNNIETRIATEISKKLLE